MKVIGTVAPEAMSGLKDKASRAERLQKDHILALLPFCWGIRSRPVLLCNVSVLEPCLWIYILILLLAIMAAMISRVGIFIGI